MAASCGPKKNIQLSQIVLLLLMCLCLFPAACLPFLLLSFLMPFGKQKGKAQSTVHEGHKSGSYTPNMKGCSHKEIDRRCINNQESNDECRLERMVRKQINQRRTLPS